jgi:hypothetical protein
MHVCGIFVSKLECMCLTHRVPRIHEQHTPLPDHRCNFHQSVTMSSEIALNQITIAALYWEPVAVFNRLFDHFKGSQDPSDTLREVESMGRECRGTSAWSFRIYAHTFAHSKIVPRAPIGTDLALPTEMP